MGLRGRQKIIWTPEMLAERVCNYGHTGNWREVRRDGVNVGWQCRDCTREAQIRHREANKLGIPNTRIHSVELLTVKIEKLEQELEKARKKLKLARQVEKIAEEMRNL